MNEIVWQLSRLRLDKINSLFEQNFMSWKIVFHQDFLFFPHISCIFIRYLPLEHHIFFAPVPAPTEYNSYASYLSATNRWNEFMTVVSKTESSKNRLDHIIARRFLYCTISSFTIKSHKFANMYDDGFFICHPNFSINNIFVDDDWWLQYYLYHWLEICVLCTYGRTSYNTSLPHPRDDTELSLTAFRAGFTNYLKEIESKIVQPRVWKTTRRCGFLQDWSIWMPCRTTTTSRSCTQKISDNKQRIYVHFSENSTRRLRFRIWQNFLKRMTQ